MSDSQLDNYTANAPANIPAEAGILAASIVIDRESQRKLLNQLSQSHFFLAEHQQMLKVLKSMLAKGQAIDAITFRAELIDRGLIESIGGTGYIADILNNLPNAGNAQAYASIVIPKAQQRWVWKLCRDAAIEAWQDGAKPLEIVYRLRDNLDVIIRKAMSADSRSGGGGEVLKMINDEISGKRRAVPMTLPLLSRYARPLTPGSKALLVGTAGGGKSMFIQENINDFHMSGVPFACLMLEKDRAFHLRRSLALFTNDLRILNDEFVRENPKLYAERAEAFQDELEQLGRSIWDTSTCGTSLDEIAIWVDQQVSDGARVIIIDPITMADTEDKPYLADGRFIRSVEKSIERTGASALISTHPRSGWKSGPLTLDDLAGSRVLPRRADCIMWLRSNEPKRASFISDLSTGYVDSDSDFNRTIRVLKAREGQAVNKDFGCYFLANGHLKEMGIVSELVEEKVND